MSQTIPNRGELNIDAIDAQIRAWVKAGHQWVDIINFARDTWPALPKDYVLASIKLVGRVLQMEKPVPIQPFRDLSIIHRKRRRLIKMLEVKLETNDASISLHTLYRGLLRDQEAGCHKIMAVQRQMEEDRKQLVKDEVAADREAKIFQQVFEQRMQQQPPAADRDQKVQPTTSAKPGMMKMLSFLIAFILAWFYASSGGGCRQTSVDVSRPSECLLAASCLSAPQLLTFRPSILSKLFVPRTVPESPPEERMPADPGNAC